MEEEITTEYEAGSTQAVTLHDGSVIHLRKSQSDMDIHDRSAAISAVNAAAKREEILTGLLYVDPDPFDLHDIIKTTGKPLNSLDEAALCPGNKVLRSINETFR